MENLGPKVGAAVGLSVFATAIYLGVTTHARDINQIADLKHQQDELIEELNPAARSYIQHKIGIAAVQSGEEADSSRLLLLATEYDALQSKMSKIKPDEAIGQAGLLAIFGAPAAGVGVCVFMSQNSSTKCRAE